MCEKVREVPRCERYDLVPAYVPSEVRGALAYLSHLFAPFARCERYGKRCGTSHTYRTSKVRKVRDDIFSHLAHVRVRVRVRKVGLCHL